MAVISKTGIYKDADGNRYVGNEGDPLPQGWTYAGSADKEDDSDPTVATAEERAKGAAPENKAKSGAPENRSA